MRDSNLYGTRILRVKNIFQANRHLELRDHDVSTPRQRETSILRFEARYLINFQTTYQNITYNYVSSTFLRVRFTKERETQLLALNMVDSFIHVFLIDFFVA